MHVVWLLKLPIVVITYFYCYAVEPRSSSSCLGSCELPRNKNKFSYLQQKWTLPLKCTTIHVLNICIQPVYFRDNDYTDICTDCLSLRGYEEYGVNDYHLDVLLEENRFFIVAPKDIVVASPYDLDDRIQWFIQHK